MTLSLTSSTSLPEDLLRINLDSFYTIRDREAAPTKVARDLWALRMEREKGLDRFLDASTTLVRQPSSDSLKTKLEELKKEKVAYLTTTRDEIEHCSVQWYGMPAITSYEKTLGSYGNTDVRHYMSTFLSIPDYLSYICITPFMNGTKAISHPMHLQGQKALNYPQIMRYTQILRWKALEDYRFFSVDQEIFQRIAKGCPNLTSVDLSMGSWPLKKGNKSIELTISSDGINDLLRHPNLRSISLYGCMIQGVKRIGQDVDPLDLDRLESLNVGCSNFQEITLSTLKLPNLTGVNFTLNQQLGDKGFVSFFASSPRLRHIDLSHTAVKGKGLRAIPTHCPHLQTLNISGCYQLTFEDLHAIAQSCPDLKSLQVPVTSLVPITLKQKQHLLEAYPHVAWRL